MYEPLISFLSFSLFFSQIYVYKSFGDTHTTVPVPPEESERSGRFVRYQNTECGIHTRANHRGAPHGGILNDLYVTDNKIKAELLSKCVSDHSLTERQACDVELLMNGGFSPLEGFLTKNEYENVVNHMRLPEQQLWPVPITLDSSDSSLKPGQFISLSYNGKEIAVLEVKISKKKIKFFPHFLSDLGYLHTR